MKSNWQPPQQHEDCSTLVQHLQLSIQVVAPEGELHTSYLFMEYAYTSVTWLAGIFPPDAGHEFAGGDDKQDLSGGDDAGDGAESPGIVAGALLQRRDAALLYFGQIVNVARHGPDLEAAAGRWHVIAPLRGMARPGRRRPVAGKGDAAAGEVHLKQVPRYITHREGIMQICKLSFPIFPASLTFSQELMKPSTYT